MQHTKFEYRSNGFGFREQFLLPPNHGGFTKMASSAKRVSENIFENFGPTTDHWYIISSPALSIQLR